MKHPFHHLHSARAVLVATLVAALATTGIGVASAQEMDQSQTISGSDRLDYQRGHERGKPSGPIGGRRGGSGPVQPVPEPGTMALASMGLVALGSVIRKRWNK
jgi:hypothetical protein